jgi:hypothetical protein
MRSNGNLQARLKGGLANLQDACYNKSAKYVFYEQEVYFAGEKIMEYVHVRKTDLVRNTSRIIRNVLLGQPTVIENHGQLEAIVVDVVDYLILRALAHYHAGKWPPLDPDGPRGEEFAGLSDQQRYNRAMQVALPIALKANPSFIISAWPCTSSARSALA